MSYKIAIFNKNLIWLCLYGALILLILSGCAAEGPQPHYYVVDKIVESLDWGNIAFNAPESLKAKERSKVELVLSPSLSMEELKHRVTGVGEIVGAKLRVSDRMEAHLSGKSFQIEAVTPEIQAISSKSVTTWRWEIHPTALGQQYLYLTISALIDVEGRDTPYVIRTFSRRIEVEVTLFQRASFFLFNYWRWLIATFLLPIIGLVWKKYHSSQEKKVLKELEEGKIDLSSVVLKNLVAGMNLLGAYRIVNALVIIAFGTFIIFYVIKALGTSVLDAPLNLAVAGSLFAIVVLWIVYAFRGGFLLRNAAAQFKAYLHSKDSKHLIHGFERQSKYFWWLRLISLLSATIIALILIIFFIFLNKGGQI